MKRTRRVEVVRYRRSTTISGEFPLEPENTVEETSVEMLLSLPRMIEPRVEKTSQTVRQITAAAMPAAARSGRFRRFFEWLIRS